MSGLTRTTFEGARAYANGLQERFRDQGLCIVLCIGIPGLVIEAGFRNNPDRLLKLVPWHDIEMGLYDALRSGIDKACREIGLGV